MLKKTRLWSGLTAAGVTLLSIACVGSSICHFYKDDVNNLLGAETSRIEDVEGADQIDSTYYKTSFGDGKFTEANLKKLAEFTKKQAEDEMREGAALLMNNSNTLPLAKNSKVTLFGIAAKSPAYQGSAAGVMASNDTAVTLQQALTKEGFTVDTSVIDATTTQEPASQRKPGCLGGHATAGTGAGEASASFYQERLNAISENAGTAIVVLSRVGAEGTDMAMDETDDDGATTISSLALHSNERAMLKAIKDSGKFGKVVVLLNTANVMEVEEIKTYCDALLFIGTPGHYGFTGVAEILSGTTNPSGHVVDTYAVSSLSAPAVVNSGTRTPDFANKDAINAAVNTDEVGGKKEDQRAEKISFQAEGIYVGYNYYETRYYDTVANPDSNASANVGVYAQGQTTWNYSKEVSYPFGYGLSYTTFEQKITGMKEDADSITLTVSVKNTGSVEGKSVVQVYAQTPYGEYEKENSIEVSAATLVGYGKTDSLKANETDTVEVKVDKYLLAQYQYTGSNIGYILSGGRYYLAIGNNVHDAVNNVLAAQGHTQSDGMDAAGVGDETKVRHFDQNLDTKKYKYSTTGNGKIVTNQFQDCDLKTYVSDVKYLSRANWKDTYPTSQTIVAATAEMIKQLSGDWYETPEGAPTYAEVEARFNHNSDLTLAMMKDVPLSDYATWEKFIYQIDLAEISAATGESFGSSPVGSEKTVVLSPKTSMGDGCDAVTDSAVPLKAPDGEFEYKTIRYCGNPVLTGTWNDELNAGRGRAMGEEGLWCEYASGSGFGMPSDSLVESSNTGLDLHRTPFGGRSFEYKSECAYMSYLASIPQVEAQEKTGSHAAPKHFVGNDQETYRDGVACFFTEQAFRQGNLRAFEGALKVANAGGIMQSFERVGCTFASCSKALNTTVTRNEWNWQGHIVTDACSFGGSLGINYRSHSLEMFEAGSQSMCFGGDKHGNAVLAWAKEHNDGHIVEKMIESAIYYEHLVANSCVLNGMTATSRIVYFQPWWHNAFVAAISVLAVMTAAFVGLTVTSIVLNKKDEKKDEEKA